MKPNTQPALTSLVWAKSSYSGNNANCVEVAVLPDGSRVLRDSKAPSGQTLMLSDSGFAVFIAGVGVGAGEFGWA
ncbi:DUF397 domain-containing protein [Streptomyces sp. NRRL F-525]|uniref:DUF397 domain-containing protein n=1 Tax=Streptomyces sp. NRRL F-525 TaxID=1463861 RepID=UPI000527E357|nr:DUF397 domain-containing protein [Streptomyces sp. NRRL F-525]